MTLFIAVGSVMGTTDALAADIIEYCGAQNITVERIITIDESVLTQNDALLVCTSTTGMGDLPASIAPLYSQLTHDCPQISDLRCGVIALGDSSYPNFAAAGTQIRLSLLKLGAHSTCYLEVDTLYISNIWTHIEPNLSSWLNNLKN